MGLSSKILKAVFFLWRTVSTLVQTETSSFSRAISIESVHRRCLLQSLVLCVVTASISALFFDINTINARRSSGVSPSRVSVSGVTCTGDVKGKLLTDKVFITETGTGHVDVPKTVTGGRCEVTTNTGDIELEID